MKRFNRFAVKLIIIFISFLLIDGGRTFIIAGNNIHHILDHKHNRDIEVPNHENMHKLANCEKWIETENPDLNFRVLRTLNISVGKDLESRGYLKSIWQPPKAC